MRSTKPGLALIASWVAALSVSSGCGSSLPDSCAPTATKNQVTSSTAAPTGPNVMTVTINGNLCDPSVQNQYPNEPCTSVTVCDKGTANCQVIKNLLVDTGSFGLRIFASVLTNAGLNTVTTTAPVSTDGGVHTLAECVGFGDGSSEWGQVGIFDVQLGGESKISNVPIQMINSTFSSPPADCSATQSTPDTSPTQVGFNGIIGVGLFAQDCGSYCTNHSANGQYYTCTSSSCSASTASLANQVQNPVAMQSTDNNGVMLQFPSVPAAGAASVTGYLVLGIGTQSNNTPSNVTKYDTDGFGNFSTVFNPFSSTSLTSFIDSGSSLIFFPWPPTSDPSNSLLPDCGGQLSGFFCPQSTQTFAAASTSASGAASSCVGFDVANGQGLVGSGKMVFNDAAGASGADISSDFDWGLPFFLGRQVYVGIEGTSSSLGTGPYWAY